MDILCPNDFGICMSEKCPVFSQCFPKVLTCVVCGGQISGDIVMPMEWGGSVFCSWECVRKKDS